MYKKSTKKKQKLKYILIKNSAWWKPPHGSYSPNKPRNYFINNKNLDSNEWEHENNPQLIKLIELKTIYQCNKN